MSTDGASNVTCWGRSFPPPADLLAGVTSLALTSGPWVSPPVVLVPRVPRMLAVDVVRAEEREPPGVAAVALSVGGTFGSRQGFM